MGHSLQLCDEKLQEPTVISDGCEAVESLINRYSRLPGDIF